MYINIHIYLYLSIYLYIYVYISIYLSIYICMIRFTVVSRGCSAAARTSSSRRAAYAGHDPLKYKAQGVTAPLIPNLRGSCLDFFYRWTRKTIPWRRGGAPHPPACWTRTAERQQPESQMHIHINICIHANHYLFLYIYVYIYIYIYIYV